MFRNFFVVIFILFGFITTYCQDSISFRMRYLPEHTYENSSTQKYHVEMRLKGSDSMINFLAQKGFKNPTITDVQTNLKNVCTTGKTNADSIMPFEMIVKEDVDGEGKNILPKDTKLIGSVAYYKMPVFTSILSDALNEEQKAKYLKNASSLFSNISLPNIKMKIGDQYVQNTPVKIPMGITNLNMIIETTYKLINVSEKIANFTLGMKFKMDSRIKDTIPIVGDGDGAGTLIYDRVNEYPLLYDLHYTMNAKAESNSSQFNIILSSKSKHKYNITHN